MLVTGLTGFVHQFVECLLGNVQLLAAHHRTCQEDELGLRIMTAYLLVELLIGLLEAFDVVIVGRQVVGA